VVEIPCGAFGRGDLKQLEHVALYPGRQAPKRQSSVVVNRVSE
jgi:hypothetical protein